MIVLTKQFRETIQARARGDPEYRQALSVEATNTFLSGDIEIGKSALRDYISETIGFEGLAKTLDKPSKSLHRMLAPSGNPNAKNFFEVLHFLQQNEGVVLKVMTRHRGA